MLICCCQINWQTQNLLFVDLFIEQERLMRGKLERLSFFENLKISIELANLTSKNLLKSIARLAMVRQTNTKIMISMVYSPEGGTVLTKALSFKKRLLQVCNYLFVQSKDLCSMGQRSLLQLKFFIAKLVQIIGTFICRSQGYDFYDRLVRFKRNIIARTKAELRLK